MQSSLQKLERMSAADPFHVAIIMDGNGRWAQQRTLSRAYGHKAGVKTVKNIIKAAPTMGITMLTLFAFSSDNWKRPESEVSHLMGLLRRFVRSELADFVNNDMRLIFIGRRDRLADDLVLEIENAERMTCNARGLTVRIALDYSARHALLQAMKATDNPTHQDISTCLSGVQQPADVDLLIRTSGEQRLSDFLLWECAYAELYFTDRHWPDFTETDLGRAVQEFQGRKRRFGGLPSNIGAVTKRHMSWGRV